MKILLAVDGSDYTKRMLAYPPLTTSGWAIGMNTPCSTRSRRCRRAPPR